MIPSRNSGIFLERFNYMDDVMDAADSATDPVAYLIENAHIPFARCSGPAYELEGSGVTYKDVTTRCSKKRGCFGFWVTGNKNDESFKEYGFCMEKRPPMGSS
jgi:hypothetical protein